MGNQVDSPATEKTTAAAGARPCFASFWHGPDLSAFERACIRSFTARGYDFTVFSYDQIANLPAGAKRGDAGEITDAKYLQAFIVDGKPSISHFTDYFRLVMFQKTDLIWADVDLVLLKDFVVRSSRIVAGYETTSSICNAILKLDNADPRLAESISEIKHMAGENLFWGATGPKLLTRIYGSALTGEAQPPKAFYPIPYDDYYKVFLPQFKAECEGKCQGSLTLHLWNNLVDKTGIWKKIGPPKGSFLYDLFASYGADQYFSEFYPEKVMRVMVDNAVMHAGPDAGIRKVLKYIVPGILNTVRRRF